jgi:hypothetical protein
MSLERCFEKKTKTKFLIHDLKEVLEDMVIEKLVLEKIV